MPVFDLNGLGIQPPVYLQPGRRGMKADQLSIPAGKEVLYGTFTMGYPPQRPLAKESSLSALIHFRDQKVSVRTDAIPFPVPAAKP